MPTFMFETCCCCVELRTGCLILGYMQLVLIIIIMPFVSAGMVGGGIMASDDNRQSSESGAFILALSVITMIMLLIMFAFTVVYLVGIYKNKRVYVKAFMIYCLVCLALGVITFPFQENGLFDIITNLISFGLSVYYLLVIRSYYVKMDEDVTKNRDDINI